MRWFLLFVVIIFCVCFNFKTENTKKYYIESETIPSTSYDVLEIVKQEMIEEVDKYITKTAPKSKLKAEVLVDECLNHNVDLVFVIAQAQAESHFGTKGLASKTNSVWNVGAYDKFDYVRINKKYKYKDPNKSIKPYLNLLTNRYLVNKTEKDLMKNFVDKHNKRYASNKSYEKDLNRLYRQICNNTRINNLQDEYYDI